MITQALAVNGAKVYITGRTKEKLDNVVKTHGQNIAGEIIGLTSDVTNKKDIQRLVKEIESREKCLCVLVNNAGISGPTQSAMGKSAEEHKKNLFDDESATFELWDDNYRTNCSAVYFMSTAFMPLVAASTEHNKVSS